MARQAVAAREYEEEDDAMSPAMLARRVGWIALAAAGIFLVVALASFDSADWPSHTVSVHNDPTRNLCGPVGALVAYWSYHVIGIGTWILLVGLSGYLGVIVTGRIVTHPVVRVFGLIFMAVAVSSFHGLLAPQIGSLAGSKAGLLAGLLVGELDQRFSSVGTFLIVLAGFSVGAIVAVDQLVLAIPPLLGTGARAAHRASTAPVRLLRALRTRPEAALATAGGPSTRRARADVLVDDDLDEPDQSPAVTQKRSRLTAEELREKIARLPVRMGGAETSVAKDEDIPRHESFEGYQFPTLELLQDPESNYSAKMEAFVRKQAEQLENALQTYHIDGEVVGIESGPAVTLYSVQLVPGTKVAKIQAVASDLARALRAHNIRLVPNMAGKTTVGIEIPNLYKERVRLKELMSGGHAEGMVLPMFLGKDASGEPLVADLTCMPHMLIAGTTGSGKSVCMNSIIMSWLYTKRPDELKLILVDPKMVELSRFAQIPHLMCPVVTEMSKATAILEWAIYKMEERYELLLEAQVRDVAGYNQLTEEELYEAFKPANEAEKAKIPKRLPYIVFLIDELADLILTHKDVEHYVVRIAQKARAVGIHLIVATQRPQANVVTGLIKSNMPCRVSFKVASGMDSRIVMDQKGAELLLGQGDMLFLSPHTTEVKRAQGTLVTDGEIRRVVKFLCGVAAPQFERSLIAIRGAGAKLDEGDTIGERDPLFEQAVEIMIESGRGSVSLLQRRLAIGYSRSSRLVDQMYAAGILGDHKGSVAREVILTIDEWEQMKAMEEAAQASGTLFADDDDDEADDDEDTDDELLEDDEEEEYEYEDDDEEEEEEEEEEDEKVAQDKS